LSTTHCLCLEKNLVQYFREHPAELRTMNRRLFEELVAEIFARFRYTVRLTKATRDGGYDVLAVHPHASDIRYLVECKRPEPGTRSE
jgi:hypothetical protein